MRERLEGNQKYSIIVSGSIAVPFAMKNVNKNPFLHAQSEDWVRRGKLHDVLLPLSNTKPERERERRRGLGKEKGLDGEDCQNVLNYF